MLQIAEWVVATEADAIAAGSASGAKGERWCELFLPKLLSHGANSMRRARELIEDHGDLREWQVRASRRKFQVQRNVDLVLIGEEPQALSHLASL